MASAEVALTLFALCNVLRVVGYVPQIVAVARDGTGASAISCTAWALFTASNLSTVLYALISLQNWSMAAVFAANTVCCGAVLGLAAYKRAQFGRGRRALSPSRGLPEPSR